MQQVALYYGCVKVWGFGAVSVQRVALWWLWDSLGFECAARGFVLGLEQFGGFWGYECAACGFCGWFGTVWGGDCAAGGFMVVVFVCGRI